jgi:uncharacterized protein YkwD
MRFVRLAGGLCALLAAVIVVAPGAAAEDPFAALLAPSGTCGAGADALGLDPTTAQRAMQCLTNYARDRAGLPPLQLNAKLNAAGDAKLAADVSCAEFSHTPCGRPFETVFADYVRETSRYAIGENIAWGTGSFGTPRGAMDAWLHSTAHRENILTPGFTELGIGYLTGQTFEGRAGATLWSQEFGTRTPVTTDATRVRPSTADAPATSHAKSRPRRLAVRHRFRRVHRTSKR